MEAEMDPLKALLILHGTLRCKTGLHVGALVETFVVGRTDAPLVRRRSDGRPYIPGASLRGKLRALLERAVYPEQARPAAEFFPVVETPAAPEPEAEEIQIAIHSCGREDCPVCRLFGNTPVPGRVERALPGRLHVEDLAPIPVPAEWETEIKTENALDRATQAANPRSFERIPAGTTFRLRLTYFLQNLDHLEEDLRNLLMSLALLEHDHLGGGGSRGYGAVAIHIQRAEMCWPDPERGALQRAKGPEDEGRDAYRSFKDFVEDLPRLRSRIPERRPLSLRLGGAAPSRRGTWVVKLRFRTPLHIGEPGVGVEGVMPYIPSDTLFSAICHAWAEAYGGESLEELLEAFPRENAMGSEALEPPFVLTSAYPYDREHFYAPKPYISPYAGPSVPGPEAPPSQTEAEEIEEEMRKSPLKDLEFIPAETLTQWLGEGLDREALRGLEELAGRRLYYETLVPRVRIGRLNHASNLYHCGLVEYPKEGGLYFLVTLDPELEKPLKACLELLGELGIGGERAVGCGKFEFAGDGWQPLEEVPALKALVQGQGTGSSDRDTGKEPVAHCLLSLYYPAEEELSGLREAIIGYGWAWRGGWPTLTGPGRPTQRRRCRMLREGSVLRFAGGRPPRGRLADVTPEGHPHRVYRSGLAFSAPVFRGDLMESKGARKEAEST